MRVTLASVQNFKRIHDVTVTPDADKAIILIGGKNAQGKSSLMDALTAAFGGKGALPPDPVRHGADEAVIRVELDGGAMIVRRTIKADGESTLEVRDAEGKLRSPQAVLDKIIGARFLDPLEFLQLDAAGQRKRLLALIDRDGVVAKLDERRQRVFDRRTDVNRDLKRLTAQLEGAPEVVPAQPLDVAALSTEATEIEDSRRAILDKQRARLRATDDLTAAKSEADRIGNELAALIERHEIAEAKVEDCKQKLRTAEDDLAVHSSNALTTLEGRREQVNSELRRASQHNQKVALDVAAADRRLKLAGEVRELGTNVAKETAEIERIDAEKSAFLEANQLPVDGLDVDGNGLRFRGVPLKQASGAEQLRVALALAMAASPNLHDVWVRDGSLLDDDSRAELERAAQTMGVTVWLEIVGTREPGAVIIQDGRVLERATENAA